MNTLTTDLPWHTWDDTGKIFVMSQKSLENIFQKIRPATEEELEESRRRYENMTQEEKDACLNGIVTVLDNIRREKKEMEQEDE